MANAHDDGTIPLSELLGDGGPPRDAPPAFPLARRGYSPPAVDAYLHEVLIALDETRNQLELAGRDAQAMWQRLSEIQQENDRHKAMPAFEGLGDHIDTLLTKAAEEADAIRARAEQEAAATAERAAKEADALRRAASDALNDAEKHAATVREQATREVDELRRAATEEAEEMRRQATLEVTKILARRDLGIAAIEELSATLEKIAGEAKEAEPQTEPAETAEPVVDLDAEAVHAVDAKPKPRVR